MPTLCFTIAGFDYTSRPIARIDLENIEDMRGAPTAITWRLNIFPDADMMSFDDGVSPAMRTDEPFGWPRLQT